MAVTTVSRQDVLASINITPLVDVMLVLLVIFMITAPALTRTVEFDLPQPVPNPAPPPPRIDLRIDASGGVYWNGAAQPISALQALLEVNASASPARASPCLRSTPVATPTTRSPPACWPRRATRRWTGSASSSATDGANVVTDQAASTRAR